METRLNIPQITRAIKSHGFTYSALAKCMDVQPAAVTQWLNGETKPLAHRLLKLSLLLDLSFDDMLVNEEAFPPAPIVAYRKVAGKTTTEHEIEKAVEKGRLLRPLAKYLPNQLIRPAAFRDPSTDYEYLQHAARDLRKDLGLSEYSKIGYSDLIGKFNELEAVIIPVMWGKREAHGNALHILLPESGATWIYLNLDSNACDFNFWMAHELAHVYTPALAGSDAGEDFAEAFAGALLFPQACATKLYHDINGKRSSTVVSAIKSAAIERTISVYTVVKALNTYAQAHKLKGLNEFRSSLFGATKNVEKLFPTISEILFEKGKPDADVFISSTEEAFYTPIYDILRDYLLESAHGAGWLAEMMDISVIDAQALYKALTAKMATKN